MTTADQSQKRRKVRALLASGLVLGVGAAVTLAAWNDSVWGNAQFGTGENAWNVQGSFDDGATWDEYITNPGGDILFDPGFDNLAPGQTVTAVVGLRENGGGDLDAEIDMPAAVAREGSTNGPAASNLDEALRMTVTNMGATVGTCDATTQSGTPLVTNQPVSTGTFAGLTIAAGTEAYLCFAVTLPAGTSPNGLDNSVEVAWEFQAESV